MKTGSLFSGYLGLDMAVEQHFDAETVWTSDIDKGASKIIAHRTSAPNLGDITKIDWTAVEPIDILTGGFPCQDLSHAGKRLGLKPGTRSGLWSHMAYAISQLRPRYVIAENVRGLLSASAHSDLEPCPWCVGGTGDSEPDLRALGAVLGDLAELGYDAQWVGLRAADIGAPHGRFRVFVVAVDSSGTGLQGSARRRVQHGLPSAGRGGLDLASNADGQRHGRGEDARPLGRVDGEDAGRARQWERSRQVAGDRGTTTATDTEVHEQRESAVTGSIRDESRDGASGTAWGDYDPAIRRWERVLGRPAPAPTETGPKGGQRLSPRFVEWMMGLPAGWVTDVPGLTRNEQLKALGNGVVPQQALEALRRVDALEAAA